ncbi:MAG: hypothetical protein DRO92_01020 [Candidatus Altiarchaeales archaeon]|nr:MAG: hypothetical protein DRO92_01020 [Candidatus Altiarchaeales archaeon]
MPPEMNKLMKKGAKKLFSLTRTKIRLAKENNTINTKPQPLPLIKLLVNIEINNVDKCYEYMNKLKNNTDFDNPKSVAFSILQLMDIIEGVKYKYEPIEFSSNIDNDKFRILEEMAKKNHGEMDILIMTKGDIDINRNRLCIYIGLNPPENVIFLSAVPTSLAVLLNYIFNSDYFSDNLKLKRVNSILGQKTLINNAIHLSLGIFGAKLKDEGNILPVN